MIAKQFINLFLILAIIHFVVFIITFILCNIDFIKEKQIENKFIKKILNSYKWNLNKGILHLGAYLVFFSLNYTLKEGFHILTSFASLPTTTAYVLTLDKKEYYSLSPIRIINQNNVYIATIEESKGVFKEIAFGNIKFTTTQTKVLTEIFQDRKK